MDASDLDPDELRAALATLRGHWQLAACTQFLLCFGRACGIEDVFTEDLEIALVQPLESALLTDIIVKLLSALPSHRRVSYPEWQTVLRSELSARGDTSSLAADTTFADLAPSAKVAVLHALCEWQLEDIDHFRERMIKAEIEEDESWRVAPLGTDYEGNSYWLFDDFRLYKEAPVPGGSKAARKAASGPTSLLGGSGVQGTWSLVCATTEDWSTFAAQFAGSKHKANRELHEFLVEDILPDVLPQLEARERARRRNEMVLPRKRSTRIQSKEIERMEAQRRAIETEEQKRAKEDAKQARALREAREARQRQRDERFQQLIISRQEQEEQERRAREERARERESRVSKRFWDDGTAMDESGDDDEWMRATESPPAAAAVAMASAAAVAAASGAGAKPRASSAAASGAKGPGKEPNGAAKAAPAPSQPKGARGPRPPTNAAAAAGPGTAPPPPRKRRSTGGGRAVAATSAAAAGGASSTGSGAEPETWQFTCVCGIAGKNYDDGTPMIACDRCGVWQHVQCNQLRPDKLDGLEFVCDTCSKAEDDSYVFRCRCGAAGINYDDGREMIQCEGCNAWQHTACQPELRQANLADVHFFCLDCRHPEMARGAQPAATGRAPSGPRRPTPGRPAGEFVDVEDMGSADDSVDSETDSVRRSGADLSVGGVDEDNDDDVIVDDDDDDDDDDSDDDDDHDHNDNVRVHDHKEDEEDAGEEEDAAFAGDDRGSSSNGVHGTQESDLGGAGRTPMTLPDDVDDERAEGDGDEEGSESESEDAMDEVDAEDAHGQPPHGSSGAGTPGYSSLAEGSSQWSNDALADGQPPSLPAPPPVPPAAAAARGPGPGPRMGFACPCGIIAKSYDDGSATVVCVRCGARMHRACVGPIASPLCVLCAPSDDDNDHDNSAA